MITELDSFSSFFFLQRTLMRSLFPDCAFVIYSWMD
jgi:hypothetical protein